jgi:alpha-beta hydrolase superfamily lysophospholipase
MTHTTEVAFVSGDGTPLAGTRVTGARHDTAVVLAHGLTVDREEEGVFTSLAEQLAAAGIGSLRFDFRGHGASARKPSDMTIAGETLDLAAAVQELRRDEPSRLGIVAASFGAVPTARLLADEPAAADFVVLLNPALDLRRSLIEPEMPWARQWFTPEALANLHETGSIVIDGGFAVGAALVDEMRRGPEPKCLLRGVDLPLVVIHGSADTYVSYETARDFVDTHPRATFVPVEGAEHGFHEGWATRRVCDEVVRWIAVLEGAVDAHQ